MLYLLQLGDGDVARRVAVADRTAAALERVLLAPDLALRQQWLAEAIADDPALAVWAAHVAGDEGAAGLTTVAALAEWWSERLVARLATRDLAHLPQPFASESQPAGTSQPAVFPELDHVPPDQAERSARAYAAVLVRARSKCAAPTAESDRTAEPLYLAEMLASAKELLALWPTEEQLQSDSSQASAQAGTSPADTEEATAWFLERVPGVAWRLPALVARLHACQRTWADFEIHLEHQKLEALKELAYGASHEINNPLANIAARAQTLLVDEQAPERRRKLAAIHRQAMRAHEMIADLMLFARPPKLQLQDCDLNLLAQQVVDEFGALAAERDVCIEFTAAEPGISVQGDETQLGVAIHALMTNAIEAIGAGGHVDVAVRRASAGDRQWAEIVVGDDGPGISPHVRQHLFDPFFSGREAGRGLGFGLSKCWRIVTDQGGQIIVGSSPRGGAELTIVLPAAAPTPAN